MRKKSFCIVLCLSAFGVSAARADWDRAAYWDTRYPTNWADRTVAANVKDALATAGYTVLNADQLKTWMDGHIADEELSVVIFCNDIAPDTVVETNTATCTLRQYLDAGGKIVFYADIPFYNQGHVDNTNTNWAMAGSTGILGFSAASATWDINGAVTFTPAGVNWGLTATWQSVRPTAANVTTNLTILAADTVGNAAAWVKHYVAGDTYRGFVRTRDVGGMPNVDDLMRLAEFIPYLASEPDPADGSSVPPEIWENNVYLMLDYTPGLGAITHTAYFSDVKQDVIDRDGDHSLGSVPPWPAASLTAFVVGYDDPGIPEYARTPLVPGKTYYWCIDENDGTQTHYGKVWSFTVMPKEAWDPYPADGAEFISPDVAATWLLGDQDTSERTVSYNVYIGTDESAVANVATNNTTSALYAGTVSAATIDFVGLAADTEHFWRVDTKLAITRPPFTYTITVGNVWSFTTLPVVPIEDPNLVGYYKFDAEMTGIAFDYSGYANHGSLKGDPQNVSAHENEGMDFDGVDDYVEIAPPSTYPVGLSNRSMCAWAKTDSLGAGWAWIAAYGSPGTSQAMFIGRNAADLFGGGYGDDINYVGFWEVDTWRHICLTYDGTTALLYADGVVVASLAKTWNLVMSQARIGRQINEAAEFWDGIIDEVRIYNKVLSQKEIKVLAGFLKASNPSPADDTTDVSRTPTLAWSPGVYAAAANGSVVYYSDDENAVINRTAPSAALTTPSFGLPMTLDMGETFYWAVDTVNGVDIWPGDVWSFTTVNWLSVDDMEAYKPWTDPIGPWVFVSWKDGFGDCTAGNGNGTGAVLTEDASVFLTGLQSMKFDFDNDGLVYSPCTLGQVSVPYYYSKIEAQVAGLPSGIGSDWTIEGVKALQINFMGQLGNSTTDDFWVQLQDSSKTYGTKVFYGDYDGEDMADFNEATWHEWNIDLADFEVDLTNIVSIVIGIGGEPAPAPGGSGTIYIDDIRLYTPRCVPNRAKPAADFDNSCEVDYPDVAALFDSWLLQNLPEDVWAKAAWTSVDVGDVNVAGSFTDIGGGSYTITGGGADIWGANDAFHYAYKPLSGDGQMSVRVTDISGPSTNDWRKAGIMIRETLNPDSDHAFMCITPVGGGGSSFQWRSELDGDDNNQDGPAGVTMPQCIRLVRIGDEFTAFRYAGGQWVRHGNPVTVPMAQDVLIGLAVTSHDYNNETTASFDRVCSEDSVSMDLIEDDVINFEDYADLLNHWMEEVLWPQ